jgi:hypothetical protein
MYKVVHLTTGTYVTDMSTGEDLSYFSANELLSQVFDSRYAVFRKRPDTDTYYIEIDLQRREGTSSELGVVPKWQFEMIEEPGFWNV